MSFDSAFLNIMTQTLTVNRLTGLSRYCRVTERQTLVRSFEGEQEVATTVVWCRSTSTFSPSDKITLPDGTTPKLLAVEEYRDEDGIIHHHKLFFQG
jgi:hypothetical protein